ncbi:hypothetical protein RJ640_029975 [Escallonia rubra]|uniref:Uncharacterized protein n=1 Tax=Escallonia rubra TaxID=112253 RepID=A0AA88QVH0_9ASTE|nr:hypothetical protein RJ640_029975 [Escallonia rubra]
MKALEVATMHDEFSDCFHSISPNCDPFVDKWFNCNYKENHQKTYGAPMLWIGIYVAAVSLVCSLAMAADAYQGFRQRKLWFPSKFFGLNAASLTLLAVAMKLPVDLSSPMEALAVPISKRILELKYRDMHKTVSTEEPKESNKSSVEILKDVVRKYWLMGETEEPKESNKSSPQFVMAGSATSSTSGVICLMVAVLLVEAEVRVWLYIHEAPYSISDYGRSAIFILWIQSVGVIVGTIAPAFRWFTAVSFKCSKKESNNYRNELKVEGNSIQPLAEWKEIPLLPLRIRNRKCRKLIQNAKNSILNFCTGVQVLIVVASKTVCLISVFVARPILSGLDYCKRLQEKVTRNSHKGSDTEPGVELDLNRNVLRLEGFKGIVEFDSNQVPSLHSEEPPNTWSLPVVPLTSIAISLPNIKSHIADCLLCSVNEGLSYARLIDQTLENIKDWINLKDAANFVWVRVELHRKWLDMDLQRIALKGKTCRENLQRLADIAKDYVMEFLSNVNRGPEHEPLNWPVKVIAANSMYRISQTLLLQQQDNHQSNEELFEQLSVMIADILCACLTNLPGVITRKCFCNAIEKREESVRLAARLLGETEAILNTLQQRELPPLDPNQVAYIDELGCAFVDLLQQAQVLCCDSRVCPFSLKMTYAVEDHGQIHPHVDANPCSLNNMVVRGAYQERGNLDIEEFVDSLSRSQITKYVIKHVIRRIPIAALWYCKKQPLRRKKKNCRSLPKSADAAENYLDRNV